MVDLASTLCKYDLRMEICLVGKAFACYVFLFWFNIPQMRKGYNIFLCLLTQLHTGYLLVHNVFLNLPRHSNAVGYQHELRGIQGVVDLISGLAKTCMYFYICLRFIYLL